MLTRFFPLQRGARANGLPIRISILLGRLFICVTLLSFLGSYWWFSELLSSFRVQFAYCGATLIFILAVQRCKPSLLGGLALALSANLFPLTAYWAPGSAYASLDHNGQFRLITLNLHHVNADLLALQKVVENENPSFLVLTEFTFRTQEVLAKIGAHFKYSRVTPEIGSFGIMLFSQQPIRSMEVSTVKNTKSPIMTAQICPIDEGCFRLITLHAPRPGPWRQSQKRNDVLKMASLKAAEQIDGAVLMVGDLNLTPWSPIFSDILEIGNLSDSAFSSGLTPTWLSRFPAFGLVIDHILYGSAFTVSAYRIGPDIGSDHYPLIVDVSLADRP